MNRLLHVARCPVPPPAVAEHDLVVYPFSAGSSPRIRWRLTGSATPEQEIDSARVIELIFAADGAVVW
jgi:hypothetical protein